MTEYRCPVHDISDCSPLLNGCVLPRYRGKAHDALVGLAAGHVTVAEALGQVDEYALRVFAKSLREFGDRRSIAARGSR